MCSGALMWQGSSCSAPRHPSCQCHAGGWAQRSEVAAVCGPIATVLESSRPDWDKQLAGLPLLPPALTVLSPENVQPIGISVKIR